MFKVFHVSCFLLLPVAFGVPVIEPENALDIEPAPIVKFPDPSQLARNAGYEAETHRVTTQDGYVLQLHRVTGRQKSGKPKPAVLLLHGLLDCSATWVVSHPTRSLAFSLSDRGYDVWLGNVRGNRYGRKHKTMSDRNDKFWEFSWHEMGVYDLPSMIDYILEETKQEKIFFVGHSQGGTAFFVMASERPEYQKKLIATFALAPAVIMTHTRNVLIRLLTPIANNLNALANLIGLHEFQPSSTLIQILASQLCKENATLTAALCRNIIFLAGGIDRELNQTVVPTVVRYDPAGASVRQFVHYAQLINAGKFQHFDHGVLGNLWFYGKIQPPEYNLANINMPVYIHYTDNDALVDRKDSVRLSEMVSSAEKLLVPNKYYAHLDFVWGNNVDSLVYNKIYSLMQRYKTRQLP